MEEVTGKNKTIKTLKSQLWDILKDDFGTLVNEPDAFPQMNDYVARRFGVSRADMAPVVPSGYFTETNQQAFRIRLKSDTDLAPVAAFLREIMETTRPLTAKRNPPRWMFSVWTQDLSASGVVHLVTEDGITFRIVKVTFGYERPLTEIGSLEDLLTLVKSQYPADAVPAMDDNEDEPVPGWGR